MVTFWAFDDYKCYEVPKKASYGFVVNIRDKTRTKPSFLAVTIVQVLDPHSTVGAWMALSRTPNWVRQEDPAFRPEPMEFQDPKLTLEDVKTWQMTLPSVSDFDTALSKLTMRRFFWHATPKDAETSSWDARTVLFGPASNTELPLLLSRWFPNLPKDYQLRVSTRLMRFTPTERRVPAAPMDFYFNFCGAERAAIITSCSDYPSFARVALLKLK